MIATDRDGFPVVTCGRCAGSGTYPSSAWNGVCLDCFGLGLVYPTLAVRRLAAQWKAELHTMSHVTIAAGLKVEADGTIVRRPSGLNPGDRIRRNHGEPYRIVVAVRPTARIVVFGCIGADDNQHLISLALLTRVTFDDGTTADGYTDEWERDYDRDAATARRDELAGQAMASYRAYLDKAPARAAAAAKRAEKRAAQRAADAAARAAEEAAQRQAEADAWAATVAMNPELNDLAGDRYVNATGFMASMRDRFLAGSMSDKQVAAAVDAIRRDRQHAQVTVTAPIGRVTVTGTVTATWSRDTDYGPTYKMRVETADGWTVAGTIPRSLDGTLEEMRGRTVTLTATVEQDRDDPTHGWYSRPTKATWLSQEAIAA